MLFSETVRALNEVKQYSSKEVERLSTILHNETFLPQDFFEMINNLSSIINLIPDEAYMNMIALTNTFTNELLALAKLNDEPSLHEEIGFPHFVIVIINLNLANKLELLGVYGEAHNALLKAKDPWVIPFDPSKKEGDLYLSRSLDVDRYLLEIGFLFPNLVREFLVSRGALSFRLSKIMGDVDNEAKGVYEVYKKFAKLEKPTQYDLMFFTNYLDLINPSSTDAQKIVNSLSNCYSSERDTNHRFIIASCLAINLRSLEWTQRAISEANTYFWAELLNMKILKECHEESINGQKILHLLWEFMMKAHNLFQDRTIFELIKQKYSVIFTQILITCIEKNELHLLLSVVYNWNSFRPGKKSFQYIDDKNLFILIPNLSSFEGPICIIKYTDEIIFIPIKSEVDLEKIMELKSRVEASWYTLIDNEILLNFEEESVMSRQQVKFSKDYLEAVEEFIGIEKLQNILNELPTQINFEYLETSWTNTPIVSVLSNKTKHTFTLTGGNQSYPTPKEIKQVLIWSDPAENLSMSIFELRGIKTILEKNDISLEIVEGSDCTKERFLEKYSDPKYDLIWVISHGLFNSNNPPYSSLTISKTEEITAWELQKFIPKIEKKRYLILNACYSGCANVRNNSMGFVGLSPSAASENQIVLGHLWFVDILAAGILGVLTLASLINGESLQLSLKKASLTMAKGNQDVIDALKNIDISLEMIERVEHTSVLLKLPFFSMSGVVTE